MDLVTCPITSHISCSFWNAENISVIFFWLAALIKIAQKFWRTAHPCYLFVDSNHILVVNLGIVNNTQTRHRISSLSFAVESFFFLLKRYVQVLCDFYVQLWNWGCLSLCIHFISIRALIVLGFNLKEQCFCSAPWWGRGTRYFSSSIVFVSI